MPHQDPALGGGRLRLCALCRNQLRVVPGAAGTSLRAVQNAVRISPGSASPTLCALSETSSSSSRHRCPQCGSRVKRVLRSSNDKRRWDADDFRRYRCRSDGCSWQGLLQVAGRRRVRMQGGAEMSMMTRVGLVVLGALLAGGLTWGAIVALQAMMDL